MPPVVARFQEERPLVELGLPGRRTSATPWGIP
jgi:hypothetical protein